MLENEGKLKSTLLSQKTINLKEKNIASDYYHNKGNVHQLTFMFFCSVKSFCCLFESIQWQHVHDILFTSLYERAQLQN